MSAQIVVNFEDIPDSDLIVEAGNYTATVESAEVVEVPSKDGGMTEALDLTHRISEADDPKQAWAHGRTIQDRIWLSSLGSKTDWNAIKIKQLVQSAGLPMTNRTVEEIAAELSGSVIKLRVGVRKYTGKDGVEREANKVSRYIAPKK